MNCYSISAQFISIRSFHLILCYLYCAVFCYNFSEPKSIKDQTKPIKNDENTPFFQ